MNWDVTDRRVSPLDESGNEGFIGSDFFDRIMNYGPSLEGLEFTSDNEELDDREPMEDSARKTIYGTGMRFDIMQYQALKSDIIKYLADKLAKKLNASSVKIPWSKMKEGDILNWPPGLKFMPISEMNTNELKRLHELIKKDKLDFSSEFLESFDRNAIISDIETSLCNKLSAGTNKKFKRVPWSILRKEDIINWPEGIPFERLSRHRMKRLKLLHDLREVIFFSKDFLLKLSDPSFNNTPIGWHTIQ
jgi:hypothetical protein